uniref:Uncharacterized protein n=1 Tax=Chromera velia CCMP2878 TaxID=1169474 RepID=A0A0G4ICM6_9ALVE|eukprot:Cvel_13186.t1-p1 / transcript=Cvel_13186.t1 / gene=Cvel_13186 / organism=Chromera_velia_CCMP2878 / gene_product=hypothetical protein / transcript_product=hypothetical protein / location=Cvel_scaffold891:24035-37877(-) / protein_length=906 / sequence_SO=supercontig / SO=protein_coding / is_pseudo=false
MSQFDCGGSLHNISAGLIAPTQGFAGSSGGARGSLSASGGRGRLQSEELGRHRFKRRKSLSKDLDDKFKRWKKRAEATHHLMYTMKHPQSSPTKYKTDIWRPNSLKHGARSRRELHCARLSNAPLVLTQLSNGEIFEIPFQCGWEFTHAPNFQEFVESRASQINLKFQTMPWMRYWNLRVADFRYNREDEILVLRLSVRATSIGSPEAQTFLKSPARRWAMLTVVPPPKLKWEPFRLRIPVAFLPASTKGERKLGSRDKGWPVCYFRSPISRPPSRLEPEQIDTGNVSEAYVAQQVKWPLASTWTVFRDSRLPVPGSTIPFSVTFRCLHIRANLLTDIFGVRHLESMVAIKKSKYVIPVASSPNEVEVQLSGEIAYDKMAYDSHLSRFLVPLEFSVMVPWDDSNPDEPDPHSTTKFEVILPIFFQLRVRQPSSGLVVSVRPDQKVLSIGERLILRGEGKPKDPCSLSGDLLNPAGPGAEGGNSQGGSEGETTGEGGKGKGESQNIPDEVQLPVQKKGNLQVYLLAAVVVALFGAAIVFMIAACSLACDCFQPSEDDEQGGPISKKEKQEKSRQFRSAAAARDAYDYPVVSVAVGEGKECANLLEAISDVATEKKEIDAKFFWEKLLALRRNLGKEDIMSAVGRLKKCLRDGGNAGYTASDDLKKRALENILTKFEYTDALEKAAEKHDKKIATLMYDEILPFVERKVEVVELLAVKVAIEGQGPHPSSARPHHKYGAAAPPAAASERETDSVVGRGSVWVGWGEEDNPSDADNVETGGEASDEDVSEPVRQLSCFPQGVRVPRLHSVLARWSDGALFARQIVREGEKQVRSITAVRLKQRDDGSFFPAELEIVKQKDIVERFELPADGQLPPAVLDRLAEQAPPVLDPVPLIPLDEVPVDVDIIAD